MLEDRSGTAWRKYSTLSISTLPISAFATLPSRVSSLLAWTFYASTQLVCEEISNLPRYDVLAANAILLFPRLFSVLDHYRYFSQLLIAFRLMAIDLVAVFILILIACSGFFVAFTLSFGEKDYDAAGGTIYKSSLSFPDLAQKLQNELQDDQVPLWLCSIGTGSETAY